MSRTENAHAMILRSVAVAIPLLLALLFSVPAAAESLGTDMIGTFEIEQVYVNVPEMDVFLYALDSEGNSIDPRVARAAGVTLQIGDTIIPTGTISQAAEPVCYIFAIDNSSTVEMSTLNAYKKGIRKIISNKGKSDQIMLYTLAGGTKCVLPATDDAYAALRVLSGLTLADADSSAVDITGAATTVYSEVQRNFQSLAPRRVVMVCADSSQVLSNLTLFAGMMSGASSKINMAVYTFVTMERGNRLNLLENLSDGRLIFSDTSQIADVMLEKQEYLSKALELKTAIDTDFYGQKLDTLTLSVPALGSAIKTSTTIYMGNRLLTPEISKVVMRDRTHMLVSFNQAVSNADSPGSYRLVCEDVWGWRPQIRAVELSDDGMSAVLTTEPLYNGNFDVSLRKVVSKMTAANISDSSVKYSFSVSLWPRDQAFYLARFRLPLIVGALLLGALCIGTILQKRRDKAEEQQAEAEHLLQNGTNAADVALPSRWVTLFIQQGKAVAESRWAQTVKSSLVIGSDPAQCDLCIADSRVCAQHCVLSVEGDNVLVRALGEHVVRVNGERIGDAHRLNNNDCIKIGRSTLRFVT